MSLTGGSKFILTGGANYQIARSLRFRSSASANLTRTPAGAGTSTRIWTLSVWVKLSSFGTDRKLIDANADTRVYIGTDDKLYFDSGGANRIITSSIYRDPSAWLHVVFTCNTVAGTQVFYVNGVQVTALSTNSPLTGSTATNVNAAVAHLIGKNGGNSNYFDGYMAEYYLIDGQALTPSSFGQTDATTGAWTPIKYTGTYGTNGFYLPFSDNSAATSTTIGKDSSGNGNNWTPSGISITAGVTNDSLVDTPTNYGTDTGAGGEVRGNYPTLNPLQGSKGTPSNGNLTFAATGDGTGAVVRAATFYITSGKWYWEVTDTAFSGGGGDAMTGILNSAVSQLLTTNPDAAANFWTVCGISGNINKVINGTAAQIFTGHNAGDVFGIAFDADAGKIWFRYNGTWAESGNPATATNPQGTGISSGPWLPYVRSNGAGSATSTQNINFGQRPFANAAPSGFKALCTQNLPTPAIVKPSLYMDVNTRTGTGAAFSVTGKLFQPDIIWTKSRSAAKSHAITDSQFGTGKYWSSDGSAAYVSDAQAVTAFNSDGFSGGTAAIINTSAESLVDWLFKKSGTAGIDLVQFSGNSTNRTIAHSLGVAPSMLIVKRDGANGATIWHTGIGSAANYLALFSTAASAADAAAFNSTAPTSSVFSVGTNNNTNATGTNNMLAMLFAEVAGFSKFGSYTGNGSADGPFVHCGFRPRFVMTKRTDLGSDWWMYDTAQDTYNAAANGLRANSTATDYTGSAGLDFLSNGFKVRDAAVLSMNASSGAYIFAAFAEAPFKTARAR